MIGSNASATRARLRLPAAIPPGVRAAASSLGIVSRAGVGLRVWVAVASLLAWVPASAVPPPPVRADVVIDLRPDGPEHVVRDTVRAYQPVPVSFAVQAGDRLLLRLEDADGVLVLGVEAPSGLLWMQGARTGPDGLLLQFQQAGTHRLLVLMSADAARVGRAASFALGLRLLR